MSRSIICLWTGQDLQIFPDGQSVADSRPGDLVKLEAAYGLAAQLWILSRNRFSPRCDDRNDEQATKKANNYP
jgi:hypothetical protein